MKKTGRIIMHGLVFLYLLAFPGWAQLDNAGFEDVKEAGQYSKNMKDNGWKFDEPLVFPAGWGINAGSIKNGEYRLINDSSKAHGGSRCIYLRGHIMHSRSIDVTAGDRIEINFYVKDPEKKEAGGALYLYYKDEKGVRRFTDTFQFSVQTEPSWSLRKGTIEIPEEHKGHRVNSVIAALFSKTGVYFDDAGMVHLRTSMWKNYYDAYTEANRKISRDMFAQAREDFEAAMELSGSKQERIDVLLRIAQSYLSEKNYRGAVESFGRVLEEEPDGKLKAEIKMKTADSYVNLKEFSMARETLAGILEMGKDADGLKVEAQFRTADTYMTEKKYMDAVKAFDAIYGMKQAGNIERLSAQMKKGDAYVSAGDNDMARREYEKVLYMPAASFSEKFDVHRKTGDIYRNEKDYGKARESYHNALKVGLVNPWNKASVLSSVAGTFVTQEKFEEARGIYARIINEMDSLLFREKRNAYAQIGATYRKEGRYEEERKMYDELEKWAEKGIPSFATDHISATIAEASRLRGESCRAEGKNQEATEHYILFLERGWISTPERTIMEVEGIIGKNIPAMHIRSAQKLFYERKYGEAEKEYDAVLKSGDAMPRQKAAALMGMGDIHLRNQEYDRARAFYTEVFRLKAVQPREISGAALLIADAYCAERQYSKAVKEYTKVLGMKESDFARKLEAQEKIADAYRADFNYSQARKEYEKLLGMEGLTALQKEEIKQRIRTIYH
ncbi:MAG TPA: tetratricopeptide repeat protein [bacterium]|nr:tetratricopeptide repeat protein [bacterium]